MKKLNELIGSRKKATEKVLKNIGIEDDNNIEVKVMKEFQLKSKE